MKVTSDRRSFLRAAAWAGISVYVVRKVGAQQAKSPNERIQFACIGIGGKGSSDSADAARFGDVVAISDIDENRLNAAAKRFEGARRYTDFRKLLEEMEGKVDAVTISTTDHTHGLAGVMAMRMGMHCFCQKPLTRTIYEARLMGQVEGGNADGKSRYSHRWPAAGGGYHSGRSLGEGHRGARLDESSHLAPGWAAA
jgi:hypothetical protein